MWNLFFVAGIVIGGFLAIQFLGNTNPMEVHPDLVKDLADKGISDYEGLLPDELFSWSELLTLRGFVVLVLGGFMVGFGTRYAGGCTSGHSIMGLSTLQWPSLIATCCFMIGGILMSNFILPFILSL